MAKSSFSKSVVFGMIIASSAGLMDAYSYLFRDGVFANAQTGNIILFFIKLCSGEYKDSLRYLFPIVLFACGILVACIFKRKFSEKEPVFSIVTLLAIMTVLFSVGFMPTSINVFANALISFGCGIQLETFSRFGGAHAATTMCIGNLRLFIHNGITYLFEKTPEEKQKSLYPAFMILAFSAGAVLGSKLIGWFGRSAIFGSVAILLISIIFLLITEGKNNHSIN